MLSLIAEKDLEKSVENKEKMTPNTPNHTAVKQQALKDLFSTTQHTATMQKKNMRQRQRGSIQ